MEGARERESDEKEHNNVWVKPQNSEHKVYEAVVTVMPWGWTVTTKSWKIRPDRGVEPIQRATESTIEVLLVEQISISPLNGPVTTEAGFKVGNSGGSLIMSRWSKST